MIEQVNSSEFDDLIAIWDSSVSATHHFLKEEDFLYYKSRLYEYFIHVNLFCYKNSDNIILGFLGLSEDKVEMLFVDDQYRGIGVGKQLLNYAINTKKITKVDVNEQNIQALLFYKSFGFKQIGYSEIDSERKDYPIIFMSL